MPDDTRTVPVTLDLDPETAAALGDPMTRALAWCMDRAVVLKGRVT